MRYEERGYKRIVRIEVTSWGGGQNPEYYVSAYDKGRSPPSPASLNPEKLGRIPRAVFDKLLSRKRDAIRFNLEVIPNPEIETDKSVLPRDEYLFITSMVDYHNHMVDTINGFGLIKNYKCEYSKGNRTLKSDFQD